MAEFGGVWPRAKAEVSDREKVMSIDGYCNSNSATNRETAKSRFTHKVTHRHIQI